MSTKSSVLFLLAAVFSKAQAGDSNLILSELDFYRRCTIHLTSSPIPLKDPRQKLVQSGELTGLQACLMILDSASLAGDGKLAVPNNKQARAVLKTFFSFHRTWFAANTLEQIQDYSEEVNRGSNDVYDAGEPALMLTRNLLADLPYRQILTAERGVRAIREENQRIKSRLGFTVSMPSRRIHGNYAAMDSNLIVFEDLTRLWTNQGSDYTSNNFLNLPMISVGDLIGIRETSESVVVPNLHLNPLGEDINRKGNLAPGLNYSYDFFKTYGSGILGLPTFVLMNYGHIRGLAANGTTKLPRRWIQAGLESLMCSPLPSLRESDVIQNLRPNSPTPFRQTTSCLQCHSTLDQLAYTGRNFTTGSTNYFLIGKGPNAHAKYPIALTSYQGNQTSVADWPDSPVDNFHLQQPQGRILMRTLNGELLDRPVGSLKDVGPIWAATDDFYTCAAKRYFEYFTGIQVPLYDRTDPKNEELNRRLSPASIKHRSYVENLGHILKERQSLKDLIREILSSEYYRSKSFQGSQ